MTTTNNIQSEEHTIVVPKPTIEKTTGNEDNRLDYASQWQLMRRRFFKHKLAVGALLFLGILYLTAAFAPF